MNAAAQTRPIDVSVILNVHREALFIRATILSLNASALFAAAEGINSELIVVFDRSDALTRKIFNESRIKGFSACKSIEVDVGSLGLARNAGIAAASGKYIWTADGDDLNTRNAILELYRTAEAHEGDSAVFLNYVIGFGERYFVAKYFDGDLLTVADFACDHPFNSRIFLPRHLFQDFEYTDLRLTEGYAYEDWEFNARLRHAGTAFRVAPNTAMYYRQRTNSLLRQANGVSARIIPHTPLFEPGWFVEELDKEKRRLRIGPSFSEARQELHRTNAVDEILHSTEMRNDLIEASRIDPEIELTQIERTHTYIPVPRSADHWGFRLAEAFRIIGQEPFTDVVLFPWLNPGGGEKYILQVLDEIANACPQSRILVICGESALAHVWMDRLPLRSTLLDVFNTFPSLDDEARDKLTMRLLLAVTERGARLHIKTSLFSHRFIDTYGSILHDHFKSIYYRFCDGQYTWHGTALTHPFMVRTLRRNLPKLSFLISDCRKIGEQDNELLGISPDKYHVIYAHVKSRVSLQPQKRPQMRLLWASRICAQKRPDMLLPIIRKLKAAAPELVIEIYGDAEPHFDLKSLFDDPGLQYYGSFDGFDSLPLERYDALLYTSETDGLPNIVLESMASGLPVISADVGGIGEAVISGETGYLVPHDSNVEVLTSNYATAVVELYGQWENAPHLSRAASKLIEERHSEARFAARVREVLSLQTAATNQIPDRAYV